MPASAPWEKYQSTEPKSEANDGPWAKYQAPKEMTQGVARVPNTEVESAALGAAQGATLGFADELEGVAKAAKAAYDDPSKRNLKALAESYKKNRDDARVRYEQAQQDNPGSFIAGEVGGGLFTPGVGFLRLGKTATSLGSKLLNAATAGSIAGAGTSNADLTKGEFSDLATDTAGGAVLGLGVQGALSGAGAIAKQITPTNLAKKTANVLMNTPEEITDTYIKNRQGVLNAPKRFELANAIEDQGISPLKDLVSKGSQESRKKLAEEGTKFKTSDLADFLNQKANEIGKASEGIMDDPQKTAAYNWLRQTAKQYEDAPVKEISANRLKDFIQTIDRSVDFDIGPGKFGAIDDTVKKEIRKGVDKTLKEASPAYAQQMKQVSSDASLLKDLTEVASSPRGWANVFRKLETDQYGSGQIPAETLKALDARLGSNFVEQAKFSNAREAFDKSVTNGSRNVNLFSNTLREIPIIGKLAPLIGGSIDKYGRNLTMKAVDGAALLNDTLQREGVKKFLDKAASVYRAAQAGNPAAAITFQILSQSNPEAVKIIQQQEAMERRLTQ